MHRSAIPVLILALSAASSGAMAVIFTPTSFADAPDANPGNGVCSSTLGGACTLRAAIMEANALPSADIVKLSGGTYALTIANLGANEDDAATGDLDIKDDLQILSQAGVFTTVDGSGLDRIFDVLGSGSFTLSGVIVRNGSAVNVTEANQSYFGGGIALRNSGTNLIQFCIVEANRANVGGGIWTRAPNTVIRFSVLRDNRADGAVHVTNPEGSAIRAQNGAGLRIENSSLYGNALLGSGFGSIGSVSLHGSSLELFSSTINGDSHAGINAYHSAVTLGNATITANAATGLAWANGAAPGVSLFMRNSIVAGNAADCMINPHPGDTIDINGHNIDSDQSCGLSGLPVYDNQSGIPLDFLLGPLDTQIALPARFPDSFSPARDRGSPLDPTLGSPEACFRYDQRGVDRSTNGRCDVGAVEAVSLFSNGFESPII